MDNFNDDHTKGLFAGFRRVKVEEGDARLEHEHSEETIAKRCESPLTPIGTPLTEPSMSLQLPPHPIYTVSAAFHADFVSDNKRPDVLLITSDYAIFHAHTRHLITTSQNRLNNLLNIETIRLAEGTIIVTVPEDSALFNVVIHAIYSMPSSPYNPPLDILLDAVGVLKRYGIPLRCFVVPTTPLYEHILREAPREPLKTFVVATENNLEDLAVATSAYLHSQRLPDITTEQIERMGPIYLKRLILLHMERVNDLKRYLRDAPQRHVDVDGCGFVEQNVLARAWALAAASLVWDFCPGMSTVHIL